jgi:hypothetical protein
VENLQEVREAVAKEHNIQLLAISPKSQNENSIERDVQTFEDKQNATMASAIQGSTLGDNIWFSALIVVIHSLNCQPHHGRMVTAFEDFHGYPPNMNDIFKYRIGQLVTVTGVSDKRNKTNHDLRGGTGYILHSQQTGSHGISFWVWIPSLRTALLRGEKHIKPVIMPGVPNQCMLVHEGPLVQGNKTYPDPAIIKLIDAHIDAEGTLTTVTGLKKEYPTRSKDERHAEDEAKAALSTCKEIPAITPTLTPSNELIGRRVEKNFKGHGFYKGTIVNFDKPYYKVTYDDGEEEEYSLAQVKKLLLDDTEEVAMSVDSMSSSNSSIKTSGKGKPAKSVTFQTTEHQQLDSPKKEFTIQEAYKQDEDGWRPVVEALLDDCINNIQSFKLVDAIDVPRSATILPASVLCKLKVDTKHAVVESLTYE